VASSRASSENEWHPRPSPPILKRFRAALDLMNGEQVERVVK
jgi:hypothetical protein